MCAASVQNLAQLAAKSLFWAISEQLDWCLGDAQDWRGRAGHIKGVREFYLWAATGVVPSVRVMFAAWSEQQVGSDDASTVY